MADDRALDNNSRPASRPTDWDLPQRGRTQPWAALIAIALAAFVGVGLLIWLSGAGHG